jgi:hypothetical protein
MPIPFLLDGFLPPGVYDCTIDELESRFGRFQTRDVRCKLLVRLKSFLAAANACDFNSAVIVDGSFVTEKDEPNDIDLLSLSNSRMTYERRCDRMSTMSYPGDKFESYTDSICSLRKREHRRSQNTLHFSPKFVGSRYVGKEC